MILAAGRGERMRPLSLLRAKPALPVVNRPLLDHTLELLARNGVREVLVNLHHLPQTVRRALSPAPGQSVRYCLERRLLGTGGGPRRVVDLLGDAPFLLVNGDVVFDFDLAGLVRRHLRSGAEATLALRPNPDPRRYGPVMTDPRGRVVSLPGSPRRAGRISLFAGVHVLHPRLLRELRPGASDMVRDLYASLLRDGRRVQGVRVAGRWWDFGTPRLYLESQGAMLRLPAYRRQAVHPSARIHPSARVARSVLGEDVSVGEGAEVVGSVVWAGTRIGRGASVRGAILAGGVLGNAGRAEGVVRWVSGRTIREVPL
jgi:NDP-sugar pyrophosphorylase family protein